MNTNRRYALAALTSAGLLWGTTVPLSKLALGSLAPGWLTFVRFGLGAVILLAAARRQVRAALTLPMLASGAVGYGGSVVVQNVGITRTSVTHAALLVGAAPVLVAIIAAIWHRTVARPVAWVGFAVSLAGVGLIAGGGGGGATAAGDGLVLASVLLSASFTVAQARLLPGRDPVAVTAVQFLGAALAMLPFSLVTEGMPAGPAHPGALLAAAGLAVGGTLLPFTLFAYAQGRVSAEVAGAFLNLEPLVGAVAGVVVFGDPAGAQQLVGGAAVLAGIALSSLPLLAAGRQPAVAGERQRQAGEHQRQAGARQQASGTGPVPAAARGARTTGSLAAGGSRVTGRTAHAHGAGCGMHQPRCRPGRLRRSGIRPGRCAVGGPRVRWSSRKAHPAAVAGTCPRRVTTSTNGAWAATRSTEPV
jgi:O-acetylserine/cysteine efflux transporter